MSTQELGASKGQSDACGLLVSASAYHELNNNHTTMRTARRTGPPVGSLIDEPGLALQLTRGLKGVPAPWRHLLYDLRRRRTVRLMGRYPELAMDLVKRGAPLSDVLAPCDAVETACLRAVMAARPMSLEEAQREETEANRDADQAQLELAADPGNPHKRARVVAAMKRQQRACDLEVAVIAQMDGVQ